MLNIEEMYQDIHNGCDIDLHEFKKYINSFKNIILWGAGNLGKAIGKKLMEMDFPITNYWDLKAKDIKLVNGINVTDPFTGKFDKDSTLVIMCIVNGSTGEKWSQSQLYKNGYNNFLLGMNLYEGLICSFKKGDKLIHKKCLDNPICSLCNCKKYINMVDRNDNVKYEDEVTMQVLTFIVSRKCTLKCIHCGQRLDIYPEDKVVNFPFLRIKHDINVFLDAVDAIGMISIIGGEPFLHPNLVEIVKYCLTKRNFGALNITTNGICKITSEMLNEIKNERVKISFSDYTKFLTEAQKELFGKNVELVKNSGISCSVGVPLWSIPPEIKKYDNSIEQMTEMKKNCESRRLCSSVVNGKYVPCSMAEVTNGLEIGNTQSDCIELVNAENLREELKKTINKQYYEVCKYCSRTGTTQIPAGEQIK